MPPDLFDHRRAELTEKEAPLAARMRPRTLDEFAGQEHIVGPGRLLRRAIQADQLSSVIFYGPPGTGKTTLARIIANTTRAHFIAINAVLAGVKDIRDAIAVAQERRGLYGQKTILFVDEVHRFNKAQQDALLPWVENGTVILIGATTENPYFEVNKALVSRSRIFQLRTLDEDALRTVARQALADPERGYGRLSVRIDDDALDHLVNVANGDARAVLNALELAVETTPTIAPSAEKTPPAHAPPYSLLPTPYSLHITRAVAEESIQRRAVLYDKDGDVHYDTISAFIKSLRGSDPDAALYWMAKMVYAGEDPRFIFRRMLIFAGEDVGLADPNALRVVVAAAQAFDYVGLPEGRFHLAEACLYLATAPKSNSAFAFFDALNAVEQEQETEPPDHLKDANRDAEDLGHGRGYLYPHAYRDHWVAQQYLPAALQGKLFYRPGDQGYEADIKTLVERRRELQLAAMLEGEETSPVPGRDTWDSSAPARGARPQNRWLQRTLGNLSAQLARTRDRIMDAAGIERHSLVLDLAAGSGLLTWEAVRRAPAGGVWALAATPREAEALQQMAGNLEALERPVILTGSVDRLAALVNEVDPQVRFDIIVGRNPFSGFFAAGAGPAVVADMPAALAAALRACAELLASGGRLSFAQTVPRHTQRIYALLDLAALGDDLATRLAAAEEAIYSNAADPMVSWDVADLQGAAHSAGLAGAEVVLVDETSDVTITPATVARWFAATGETARQTYAQNLRRYLDDAEVTAVRALIERQLLGQTVAWHSGVVFLVGAARRE
jgi:putative ATPase